MEEVLQPDFENTAPPVLLDYQSSWVQDTSELKVMEKSRRTGLSWGEASDDALICAMDSVSGGQNCYYIGYNKDMAIEFIEAAAMWCRAFNYAAEKITEGIWDDVDDEDKHIKTFTIKFPDSGHRLVALSSRPANLRGKQGTIIIDEAAFHDKLGELLKAAMAMMIWGGRVRVISTHDGEDNPFNELINQIRAGERAGTVHRITFRDAVKAGLYNRVCLRRGIEWSQQGEEEWVQKVYDFYGDDADEELDVIPSAGSGTYLTRAAIEGIMKPTTSVLRLSLSDEFTYQPTHIREAETNDWCEEHLEPLLEGLNPDLNHYFGSDFARTGDLSVVWPGEETRTLDLHTPYILEMRNVPFAQQKQILFYLIRRTPRFIAGAMDARGNGQQLAEECAQEFGSTRIAEVMLSQSWYRENMPRFKAHIDDKTMDAPKDADIMSDLRSIKKDKGVAKVPDDVHTKGSDGRPRHGDAAVAGALMTYAVAEMDAAPIEYTAIAPKSTRWDGHDEDSDMAMHSSGGGAW